MKIIWHGHSCFQVETGDASVVFDPYADGSVPGYEPLRLEADAVFCSHEHADHNAKDLVRICSAPAALKVETLPTWHDEVQGKKRGENTVHILYAESMRLAHLGDLGCELTEDQIQTLKNVDVLLIPIGGFYTIDAAHALKLVHVLQPRVVIPMHFRFGKHGYDVIGTLDPFVNEVGNARYYDGNSITVDSGTPAQTAVLRYVPKN